MQTISKTSAQTSGQAYIAGGSINKLSNEMFTDLAGTERAHSYPANTYIFTERDQAQGVYLVLDGEVKLSMNSGEGKRLILRIAKKGEMIGLASAVTGSPHEMTAETIYPAKLAFIARREFLNFLTAHPDIYQAVTMELSRQYSQACEQLRMVGLSNSAPEKLARLLLDWSDGGQETESGMRFRFSLTHEEIGEFIGTSRETVTRTLSIFKMRRLVAFKGSTAIIPNRTALESYAGC